MFGRPNGAFKCIEICCWNDWQHKHSSWRLVVAQSKLIKQNKLNHLSAKPKADTNTWHSMITVTVICGVQMNMVVFWIFIKSCSWLSDLNVHQHHFLRRRTMQEVYIYCSYGWMPSLQICLMCKNTRNGARIASHLSLSSSFFRSFMSRWTTFKMCSASSSVRPDRSIFRPIVPGLATLSCCCWSKKWRKGEAEALLLWGPRLGRPWGQRQKK